MIRLQNLLTIFVLTLFAFIASACNDERPVAKIIVVDQKMPLIEWPDSIYVNSLDSILALEPIKKNKGDEKNTHLVLNPNKAPIYNLPSNTKKKDDKKSVKGSQENRGKGLPSGRENDAFGKKAEAFSDKFLRAMSALQSDPGNSNLYKIVIANDEDLSKLLRRTYGAGSLTLPGFFVQSALQTVNPSLDLKNLKAGDKVKVPRI